LIYRPKQTPEFRFNEHNSLITAHICTKFGTKTQNDIPDTELPSDFTFETIQDGGGRHFCKIGLMAISRMICLKLIFAGNFANGLKRCPTIDFAVKIHFPQNPTWRRRHFEIH